MKGGGGAAALKPFDLDGASPGPEIKILNTQVMPGGQGGAPAPLPKDQHASGQAGCLFPGRLLGPLDRAWAFLKPGPGLPWTP